MGESKHTPSPWHLVTRDGQPEHGAIAIMGRSWQAVYTCNAMGDPEADAQLIAAAPEMLDALRNGDRDTFAGTLETVANLLVDYRAGDADLVDWLRDRASTIRVAIAKATGEVGLGTLKEPEARG